MLVKSIDMDKNSQLLGLPSCMGTMVKWFFKGYKRLPLFVVKEPEIEIGCPTDVKHVGHIGWDGSASSAPSWMGAVKTGPEFTSSSIGHTDGSAISPWSSTQEKPKTPRKRRKKHRKTASTASSASGSTTSSNRTGGGSNDSSKKRRTKSRMAAEANAEQQR